jgi:hypothetical protein
VALRLRSPKSCLAFSRIDRLGARVPIADFSKRGVVAWRTGELRSVAFACGPSPKGVLSGSFQNLRRAASTKTFKRMSWRLAGLPRQGLRPHPAADWQSIGDLARDVLRRASTGT